MFGDPSIEASWKSTSTNLDEKISYLLSKTGKRVYIILLDNIDELLDESSQLVESQLCRFLDLAQSQQNSLRLILTSREEIRFRSADHCDLHHYFIIRLTDGLPNEEAIEFLREMDLQGELGLAEANDATLTEIVAMTHGVPRALQLFASILANDPFLNMQQLRKTFFDAEDVVKELVEENYLRLDNNARLVLLALAVFKRAVTVVAVDFLLQEFVPGLDVPASLRRLTRAQTVTIDRVTNQIALNEVDREWIYSLYRNRVGQGIFPDLTALNRRAAQYYRQQRHSREEWHGIEDVRQQLYQIEHLIDAMDYGEALAVIDEIDPALEIWGYYEHVVELREALNGHLTDSELMENLSRLGRLYALLGQIDKARGYFEDALGIARILVNRRAVSYLLGRLGSCAYDLGELQEARSRYEEALSVAREVDDPLLEGMNLYGLGRCNRGCFEVMLAIKRFEGALKKLGEAGGNSQDAWREEIQSQYLIAQSLNNLGLCYRVLCDVERARRHYEQALEVMNKINDRGGKAYVLTNVASLERLLGNLAEALSLCYQALDIYFDIKDRWGEGSVLRNIGILYSDLGDPEKASDYHQKALVNNRAVNNRKGKAITLLNISLSCLRDERMQEAIDYAKRSLDLFRANGAIRYESHAATQLSWSLLIDGQLSAAMEMAEKAYKYHVNETGYYAMAALGTVALRQHRMEVAEETFRAIIEGTKKQLILTDRLHQVRYLRGYAQIGLMLVCNTPISEAVETYDQAMENCSAPGILAEQRVRLAAFGEYAPKLKPIRAILSPTTQ
jgi:tetratricopeptide (TPR) repeat protein